MPDVSSILKRQVKKLPYLRRIFRQRDQLAVERDSLAAERDNLLRQRDRLAAERDQLQAQLKSFGATKIYVPLGHFYSPVPAIREIQQKESDIFGNVPDSIPDVDMNEEEQWRLVAKLAEYYKEMPFREEKQPDLRYFFNNPSFIHADAIFLYSMIRHIKPRRVIEVGAGYSSCAILDTNELFFGNTIACTFIEPYPQLLLSLLKDGDLERIDIVERRLQDVETERFQDLSEGDLLCIDSTHVSKIDSDVNHALFRILPHIQRGVYVHFHDVLYPFEYPKEWVYEGRGWTEAYLLRAFLAYNSAFKIALWHTFLLRRDAERFVREMPLTMKGTAAGIWLKKVGQPHALSAKH